MSKHAARTIPPERQRSHLEQKHAELSERVAALDSRMSLTPAEELELHQLKKEKLYAKDALSEVG
ncbi:MAG: YdcH family protein [Deltaproteobacteria bacterium]|nr:YdcH family protein [Deltaproteobacteria bacterium]NND30530.1 YdcH family protein [Myxococcales bacterium]MBT8465652.1 YdcH family protein [Deltaproteobacteria bacterium]MBT8480546.1 YdcH family protein [Deltaproteobacteria bacterium]NNK09281.1 YdcH family protein [Myxococcales bacterium]